MIFATARERNIEHIYGARTSSRNIRILEQIPILNRPDLEKEARDMKHADPRVTQSDRSAAKLAIKNLFNSLKSVNISNENEQTKS